MKVRQQCKVIIAQYQRLEGRVHRSCDQLETLDRKLTALRVRHERAVRRGQRGFSRSLAMQLSVYEGTYATFYAFTACQSHQLALVQAALLEGTEGVFDY